MHCYSEGNRIKVIFFFTDREVEVVCEASFKTTVGFSFLSGAHF